MVPVGAVQKVNQQQQQAVVSEDNALVLAGAGSGKTTVLTARIQWLVQQQGVRPGELLAVTFTNKAAKEILSRLDAALPVNVRHMWVGTFHGLCNRMLRAHYRLCGLPAGFQILDMQDQLSGIKRCMKVLGVDTTLLAPKEVQWFINGCKQAGERVADMPDANGNALLAGKIAVYRAYEAQCVQEGVVDFAELLLRSYELLRDNPAVQKHYSRRFRHILVDEFQDTNQLQYRWLKLLAAWRQLDVEPVPVVFAVGDDDQSIYAFRGARVSNMVDFLKDFAVGVPIRLEQNYRSVGNILATANALIAHNSERLGKELFTEAGDGDPVRLAELADDQAEAAFVVEEVQQLTGGSSLSGGEVQRHEIAVLYRSNAQSRVLESALFNAGIAYRVYGGLRFFERAEIKHALAYLRLLDNPADDTSFLRVVNFPARGIGLRTVEQLQAHAQRLGVPLMLATGSMEGRAQQKLTVFSELIATMRRQNAHSNLRELVEYVVEHSGLLAHYEKERDGADRVENLRELVTAAERFLQYERIDAEAGAFGVIEAAVVPAAATQRLLSQSPVSQGITDDAEQENMASAAVPVSDVPPASTDSDTDAEETEMSPLAAFLSNASLEAGENQSADGQSAVQLMTVHSAKGLEFDCVFVIGLEEGLFPHENALAEQGGVEEERRLMYVAITRARKRLYLTMTQMRMLYGKTRYNMQSRFVEELPEVHVRWLSARAGRFSSQNRYGTNAPDVFTTGGFAENGQPDRGRLPAVDTDGAGKQNADDDAWHVGDGVFHNKFGEGNVTAVKGSGESAQVQVFFRRHGSKWLVVSMAKLTRVQ